MTGLPWRDWAIFWVTVAIAAVLVVASGFAKDRPPVGVWWALAVVQTASGALVQHAARLDTQAGCHDWIAARRALAEQMRAAQLKAQIMDPVSAVHVSCRFILFDALTKAKGA
jgi:hypothetical protein